MEGFVEAQTFKDSLAFDELPANAQFLIKQRFLSSISRQLSSNEYKNTLILLDDLFYYESMRHSYFKLAIELECVYVSLLFKCESVDLLLKRDAVREPPRRVGERVVRKVFEKFEFFDHNDWESNFSRIELVDANSIIDHSYLEEFLRFVLDKAGLLKEFLAQRKQADSSREISNGEKTFSLAHQSDLVLRRLVSQRLASESLSKSDKARLSKELAARKSAILDEIKTDSNGLRSRLTTLYLAQSDETERYIFLEKEFKLRLNLE